MIQFNLKKYSICIHGSCGLLDTLILKNYQIKQTSDVLLFASDRRKNNLSICIVT